MADLKTFAVVLAAIVAAWAVLKGSTKDNRVANFSAGPGCLPVEVLKKAQSDFVSMDGLGMNIMEMSHRDPGGPVQSMIAGAEANVRELLAVPDNYHVFYMASGAHAQFAAVPMNLLNRAGSDGTADYVVTGYWSERSRLEATKQGGEGAARRLDAATADGSGLLPVEEWGLNPNAAYVHICASETIDGLEFVQEPELPYPDVPLVGDFTSTLLSRQVDISKYGVIYASGGKNLGPSGFALVIVRDDLVNDEFRMAHTPAVLDWSLSARRNPIPSIYNTPPVFPLYMHSLVLEHVKATGGMEAMQARVLRRANAVYDVVAASNGFYATKVSNPACRSRMNVPMTIVLDGERRKDLETQFVQQAKAQGMLQLFGHPVRGGLRVTLYNGIPDEAVDGVVKFMADFYATNTKKPTPQA